MVTRETTICGAEAIICRTPATAHVLALCSCTSGSSAPCFSTCGPQAACTRVTCNTALFISNMDAQALSCPHRFSGMGSGHKQAACRPNAQHHLHPGSRHMAPKSARLCTQARLQSLLKLWNIPPPGVVHKTCTLHYQTSFQLILGRQAWNPATDQCAPTWLLNPQTLCSSDWLGFHLTCKANGSVIALFKSENLGRLRLPKSPH